MNKVRDYLKSVFAKFSFAAGRAYAIDALKSYALKSIAGLHGIQAWAAKIVLKFLVAFVEKMNTYLTEKEKARKKLDDFNKVINNPNSTAEEVSDAADDFLK